MSYSNQTTHFGIPLPTSSDLVNLLDWNQSSEDIDAAIYSARQGAEAAGTDIVAIKATMVQLQDADVHFQSELNAIDGRVTSLEQTSGNIEEDVDDIADMITAKEIPTAQSDQRILVDEWFRYNGVLYVCTVQIEIGDTIVPNVNCRATNIESEMATGGGGAEIDDTTTSASKVWSSQKTSAEINNAVAVKSGDVRFSNGKLQQYNGSAWVDVQIGGNMPDLDYASPLHSFLNGTQYTASKECYLSGFIGLGTSGTAITIRINGTQIFGTGSGGLGGFLNYKLNSGDTVVFSTAASNCWIFGLKQS